MNKRIYLLLILIFNVQCLLNLGGLLGGLLGNKKSTTKQSKIVTPISNNKVEEKESKKIVAPVKNSNFKQENQGHQTAQENIKISQSKASKTLSSNKVQDFQTFAVNNHKQYETYEQSIFRQQVLSKNQKKVAVLKQTSSYSQGTTFYSDYTEQQFKLLILNPNIATTPEAIESFQAVPLITTLDKLLGSKGVVMGLLGNVAGQNGLVVGILGKDNVLGKTVGTLTQSLVGEKGVLGTVFNGLVGQKGLLNNILNPKAVLGGLLGGGQTKENKHQITQKNKSKIIENETLKPSQTSSSNYKFNSSQSIKTSVDWRSYNYVSHVKMQGVCGNCYAFSATGAIQSAYMIKYDKNNVSYSDQQITDCCVSEGYGCNGCDGGWQWQAFQYVKQKGIVFESQYPTYSSDQGIVGQCKKVISPNKILNETRPFVAIPQGNITALYQAVSQQPVAVGVDASNMQFASSTDPNEIFTNCSSSFDDANHAMLVVGFDTQGNWILKNSWSNQWGNQGYIKLKSGNTCGVANYALLPRVV